MKSQFDILLEQWVDKRVITKRAATRMQTDWKNFSAERAGNRWTAAISTIGAILLGIAAISFIATNWETLGRESKLFLALFITLGTFGVGIFLAFMNGNYPKTGKALIFLSTIAFGATLALISQIYHLTGAPWKLLALWTVGILPVAYAFHIRASLHLGILTGIFALLLFLSGAGGLGIEDFFMSIFESFIQFHTVLLICLFLFAVGSLHLLCKSVTEFGRIIRLVAIKIFLFFTFWLTFPDLAEKITEEASEALINPEATLWKNVVLALLAAIIFAVFVIKEKRGKELIGFASAMGLALLFLWGNATSFYESGYLFGILVLLANLFFIGASALLLFEGYRQENLKAVNFATFAIGAFIFGKYIDLFAGVLDGTMFFFMGGVILVGGGIFLEKKRRTLTQKFAKK